MNDKGWIKLYRQLQDSELWRIRTPYDERSAWIEFLLTANHSDKSFMTRRKHSIMIRRGQLFTSIRKLAARFSWSENRVRRYLVTLEQMEMVHTQQHSDGTIISIVNYEKYQGNGHSDGTTKNSAVIGETSNTPHADEHTDEYTDEYTGEHANEHSRGTRTRIYKNNKNVKEVKEEREGQAPRSHFVPSEEFVEAFCAAQNLKVNVPRFMAYYGARDWTLGKGMKVERQDQLEQLIKSWATTYVDNDPAKKDGESSMPYFEEFSKGPAIAGTAPKFEGGLVAEMIRRKKEKNA